MNERWKYRLRNIPALWRAYKTKAGVAIAEQVGAVAFLGELYARVHRVEGFRYEPGRGMFWRGDYWEDLGLIGARLVTDAGVAFLVDDWDSDAQDITTMNFHGGGTGVVAENVADTALGTEVETREAGTKSQPAANQLRSVATHTFSGTFAITEHGLFSASSGGTLWDRTVFSAINVVSGDAIEYTYTCTVNSGG